MIKAMIFAKTIKFSRYGALALSLSAGLASSACSDSGGDNPTSGPGGSGGTAGSGGAGGSGGSGATGGSTGGAGGSGGATGGSAGAGGSGVDAGTGLSGAFTVTLKNDMDPAFTDFVGQIYSGPQPPAEILTVDSEEAGCKLMVPKPPFCMGGCGTGVCVAENVCIQRPTIVGVGTAVVTGFKDGEFSIPQPDNKIYQALPTLPANACSEGDALQIKTDKFTLQGKCIAPFEILSGMAKIPVKKDMPVKLTWKPPAQAGMSRVLIDLDISHHGGKKGEINCEVPDTGSFDIPATLATKLINLGVAGFPTIVVQRISATPSDTEPGVKLQVLSGVEREVDTGVVSCTGDMDCPPGQKCQPDLTCK
jgi:hypothetical protein